MGTDSVVDDLVAWVSSRDEAWDRCPRVSLHPAGVGGPASVSIGGRAPYCGYWPCWSPPGSASRSRRTSAGTTPKPIIGGRVAEFVAQHQDSSPPRPRLTVSPARTTARRQRHLLQHHVPGPVPAGVVHRREFVQVQEQQRHRPPPPVQVRQGVMDQPVDQLPVRQPVNASCSNRARATPASRRSSASTRYDAATLRTT